ncbi:MAG: hypothetical protein R3A52_18305 [Polyangiales bacterium]
MFSARRLALCAVILALGCAQGRDAADDASKPLDATAEDLPADDLATPDTDVAIDASSIDAPDVPAPDVPTPDVPAPDVPPADVSVDDVPAPDIPAPDVPAPDTGPVGPVRCNSTNAAMVCGSRPCVDGYCCDSPCAGACRSCSVAGSEGRCTNAPSGSDPDDECDPQPASTCGATGACDGAGACARHPSGTPCDDGAACTTGDVCDGAGTCRGAAPAMCAPGAGNECCLGSCDPMMGCRTAAGLCADQCSANRLRTSRVCQGCGAAGAVGACGGGGEFTCDASAHSLCQSIACGGQTFYCTNDGGTWQWRTAARCDDGDPCTHTDACAMGSCRGAAVSCVSDACMTRACQGTASCAQTPRPGEACDDGNAMTNLDRCSSAGVCVGTVVCGLPSDACTDGTQSRDNCGNARVISRRTAASTSGYTVTADTCSARNRFDDCSWDAGGDHAYRIWARSGETVTATITRGGGCVSSSWDVTMKIYQGADCGTVPCRNGDRWCHDHVASNSSHTYTATRDGWLMLVVDGSTAFDDEGAYGLRVRLSGCRDASCECP